MSIGCVNSNAHCFVLIYSLTDLTINNKDINRVIGVEDQWFSTARFNRYFNIKTKQSQRTNSEAKSVNVLKVDRKQKET